MSSQVFVRRTQPTILPTRWALPAFPVGWALPTILDTANTKLVGGAHPTKRCCSFPVRWALPTIFVAANSKLVGGAHPTKRRGLFPVRGALPTIFAIFLLLALAPRAAAQATTIAAPTGGTTLGVPPQYSLRASQGRLTSSGTGGSPTSGGGGFRPAPGSARVSPQLSVRPPGMAGIMEVVRPDLAGGILAVGPVPAAARATANIQRLRSEQMLRSRMQQQVSRRKVGAHHDVSHVLTLGFPPPPAPAASSPATADPMLASRVAELRGRIGLESLEVERRGATAIVTGSPTTADRRDVISQFLLLEPGIEQVDNRLPVPARGI